MLELLKPLAETTAGDLMSRELLLLPDDLPLPEAARLLVQHRVSGAPVVRGGRLVGVLSSTDFVRLAGTHPHPSACDGVVVDWQVVDMDTLPSGAVRCFMTRPVVTAEPDTPLHELAGRMVEARVHRIVVVDRDHAPVGIVTSTDILAAVARSRPEAVAIDD